MSSLVCNNTGDCSYSKELTGRG